jgi:hypothetical protein
MVSIPPTIRGRLRRRARRNNRTKNKQPQSTKFQESNDDSTKPKSRPDPSHAPSKHKNVDPARWRYNSGEVGTQYVSQKAPVALVIDFDYLHSRALDHNDETDPIHLDGNSNEAFTPRNNDIPVLTIRTLRTPAAVLKPKRFHIMSYFNPTFQAAKMTISDPNSREATEIKEKVGPLDIQPYEIHIADLIDEAGAVNEKDGSWAKIFFSMIEANLSAIQTSRDPDSAQSNTSLTSKHEQNQYWHKYSSLLYGFEAREDARKLPYSNGYGVKHNSPILIVKQNRWGYFDVDNMCYESQRVRWRAAWKFEVSQLYSHNVKGKKLT